ncbi:MAG TPA: glycerol-3-phosphate dehydrogenase/oxidase [Symbiobacteriaceae bacterium]|nr:glycerol-3-phosphate dehydrogenase/oxidase [Symbiobacteriaceae bacterium]
MTAHPFSSAGRLAALEQMASREMDLLIMGGGITGCGLARAAAMRGLSVALVERDDFGCGTSSRSSKLIHGGLRYLEHGDVGMVWEAARERRTLRRIAPHLVHPLPFLFPIFQGNSLTKYRFGLWLFDRLAGAAPADRYQMLTAEELLQKLPGLRRDMKGGFMYGEYVTDDARLTLENALSAAEYGALLANHAPALALDQERGRVVGATVRDELSGLTHRVRARVTVNATGPWAAATLALSGKPSPKALLPSKGIHILFRAARLPVEGAVALIAPSGRSGFAIRRWDYVYAGTTDDSYDGPMDLITADGRAISNLLDLVRECFPALELTHQDIIGTWAGLRPLIAEPGKTPRDTSRHDEVWSGPEGLLTVAGGKLTTYRPMSRRVMTYVEHALGLAPDRSPRTGTVPLPGARGAAPDLKALGIGREAAERIAWLYGAHAATLLAMGLEDSAWLEPVADGVPVLRGEVRLAVEHEMAMTVADFLDRRSSLLLFSPDHGLSAAAPVSELMGGLLGWTADQREQQVAQYRALAAAHRSAVE